MYVTAPDGTGYHVTRRWLPWRRRTRGGDGGPDVVDVPAGGGGHHSGAGHGGGGHGGLDGDDLLIGLAVVLVLVVLVPLVVTAVLPLLELLVLVLLLPAGVIARVAFGRPWEVEVRPALARVFSRSPVHTEMAGGWSASGSRIMSLADEVRRGQLG